MASEPIDPGKARQLLQKDPKQRGYLEAPKPVWNQAGFKDALRSALRLGMTFFEFDGGTYTIEPVKKHPELLFIKGPKGQGQLSKEKALREGDEWY
jgi:hypothetical protein